MTRNGKIARLPRSIRDQLNRRLQDGEEGSTLLEWLNALRAVQEVLKQSFDGQPVSKKNLSEWRHGGYREWERHEESCDLVRRLTEQTNDLWAEADGVEVSHWISTLLAVELARVAEGLLEQATDPQEHWRRLREVLRELAQLRQEDRKTGWLSLERERREEELGRRAEEERESDFRLAKEKILAPIWARMQLSSVAQVFGGGETGREAAAFMLEVMRDLPFGTLTGKVKSDPVKPSRTESNPIKPDQKTGPDQ
jgi:hypothetical protein